VSGNSSPVTKKPSFTSWWRTTENTTSTMPPTASVTMDSGTKYRAPWMRLAKSVGVKSLPNSQANHGGLPRIEGGGLGRCLMAQVGLVAGVVERHGDAGQQGHHHQDHHALEVERVAHVGLPVAVTLAGV
jgi:hypothetical protein